MIEANGLTKVYQDRKAVDGISLTVEEGEIFGFLGPNGAGKTTTIRILTGQLRPTAGWACVSGYDVNGQRDQLKAHIGVVFEHQNLYERMSVRDNLLFYASLYNAPVERVSRMLDRVDLADRAKDRVQRLSNGMKQRLLIARALLHEPCVLFLDEPTRGLDPNIAQDIRLLIKNLAKMGATIFLTTHYMEEADQICHRVAIVNEGVIVALDNPKNLKLKYGDRGVNVVLKDGQHLKLGLEIAENGRRLGELAASGRIQTLHSGEPTLEEVFIRLTGRRLS